MADNNSSDRTKMMHDVIPPEGESEPSSVRITVGMNEQDNLGALQKLNGGKEPNSCGELENSAVYSEGMPGETQEDIHSPSGTLDETSNANAGTECCPNCKGLQKKLVDEEKRCAVLRANIHKVSANWFQRKTQLSESEVDVDTTPVGLLDQTMRVDGDSASGVAAEVASASDTREGASKSKDLTKLLNMIAQKSAQLEVSDSQCHDLKRRLRECEKIIDDKEDIIHGLKDQLETYLTDNQQMSLQLNNLAGLFQQLEKADQEFVSKPKNSEEKDDTATAVPLPTQDEFQEMTKSVSKTYIKLKDLIYEKKALVTEIERLNTLNVELQKRVVQQETRLVSVTDALHQTWLVVSGLKEQHAKLHDDELIMRYELKQKRNILTKLRRELESSRAQWQMIRQKNQESEEEYASIRAMLRERRKETSESISEREQEPEEPDDPVCLHPDDTKSFDPPVDLLLEMGLEYGIIGEEAEMTQTVLDVIGGVDVRNNRLEQLEEHCSLLYQKLIASTSRSLFLASRLSRLHRQFGSSDEDEDIDDFVIDAGEEQVDGEENQEDEDDQSDDEEEGAEYYTDADRMALMESVLSSPVSEEYDTAYVSETDATEPQAEVRQELVLEEVESVAGPSTRPSDAAESEPPTTVDSSDTMSSDLEDSCDHLSRTLINFLPRKIEFLKKENKKLESQLKTVKEEREAAEARANGLQKDKNKLEEELKILAKDIAMEKLQRQQLEEQLKHLGKCVDQLRLDHKHETTLNKDASSSPPSSPSSPSPVAYRSEGERRTEDEKIKREVALLKKEMELKKREKEIRRREEEQSKIEELFRETKGKNEGNIDEGTGAAAAHEECCRSPRAASMSAVIEAAVHVVEESLLNKNASSTADHACSLVNIALNTEESSVFRPTFQKPQTLENDHNFSDNETREKLERFLSTEKEEQKNKGIETELEISKGKSIEKGAVPKTRINERESVSTENAVTNSGSVEAGKNKEQRRTMTFVLAPVITPEGVRAGGVREEGVSTGGMIKGTVNIEEYTALLIPFRLGTPDAGTPDAGAPDAGAPDAGAPDAGAPDAGTPDAGTPDAGTPDAGTPDAGTPDAGTPGTGTPDAGTPDAGTPDAGILKTSSPAANVPAADTQEPAAAGTAAVGAPEESVAIKVTARGRNMYVTAFRLDPSTTTTSSSSPSSPEACGAPLVMPVMRVMKDDTINITITDHHHSVTTVVITSTSNNDGDEAVVQYDIQNVHG